MTSAPWDRWDPEDIGCDLPHTDLFPARLSTGCFPEPSRNKLLWVTRVAMVSLWFGKEAELPP